MAPKEKTPKGKMREPGSEEPSQAERPVSSEKVMQTFRMPLDVVYALKADAVARGSDTTAHIIRIVEGYQRYYGLPRVLIEKLEEDRRQMGMDKFEYLQHVLYRRSEAVQTQGVGFDRPGSVSRARRIE
jgi:hypothetical protein